MNEILPIFVSDASLGRSILTTDKPQKTVDGKTIIIDKPELIDENAPVSIFSICNAYKINPVIILETSMISFVNCYNICDKLNKQ